ncbi:hypothetical protein K432DRAFT_430038 [Lepidopterella palustris CBS 459.81]|uniref:Uncharacterized protein n=1 Tax=Lepidopterella palustris CBS 459.81 TaxID=1314670 RepID=A0A8E2J9H3_9PEZI|nr:hypothetical protein K432DRAFT_430038 [Lepidopterella palustris CBS 459.81]
MAKISLHRRDEQLTDEVDPFIEDDPEDESESKVEQIIVSVAKGGKVHYTRGGLRVKTGKGPGKGKVRAMRDKSSQYMLDKEDEEGTASRSRRAPIDPTQSLTPDSPREEDDNDESNEAADQEIILNDQNDGPTLPLRPLNRDSPDLGLDKETRLTPASDPVLITEPNEFDNIWRYAHVL